MPMDINKELEVLKKRAFDLETEKNSCKLEASRFKDQRDSYHSQLQEITAQLLESQEELKSSEEAKHEKESLIRENQKLQDKLLISLERLKKSEERAAYLVNEKFSVWNSFNEQVQLLKESALNDLKAMKSNYDDCVRENAALRAYNDELCETLEKKERMLVEQKQQLEDAKQSYFNREKAANDLIQALEKINDKLRQRLQQSNGVASDC